MVQLDWKEGMLFEALHPSGAVIAYDARDDGNGGVVGPTPLETLLSSIAGCMAMDVISILQKKRQEVKSYRIRVEAERDDQGDYPRPFTSITLIHELKGEIDPAAAERAVQLSEDKYCSVLATLKYSPPVRSEILIES
ncbi:MAG: OsmC family protein [Fimbriimonadaceae bacterium]